MFRPVNIIPVFPLINMWWGLGNQSWTTISRQFKEVKVTPKVLLWWIKEGPKNVLSLRPCAGQEISFICDLTLICLCNHSRSGVPPAINTDLGHLLTDTFFFLCGTMTDLISEGPPSCVFYLLLPIKNSAVAIPNKRGVEPSVFLTLGGARL